MPQIPSSKDQPGSSASTDDIGMRSPGAKTKFKLRPLGERLTSDSAVPKQIKVCKSTFCACDKFLSFLDAGVSYGYNALSVSHHSLLRV